MLAVLFVAFVAVCIPASGVPAKSGEIVTTAAYQIANTASAALFVAPSGRDSNLGTEDRPFRTLKRARLRERISGLEIAGCEDGYFAPQEEPGIIEDIRQKRPGVLLVALGIPRQEKWIKAHLEDLRVPICIGVGGSLDVISGRKKRAPVWMQRAGLEWLYRTIKEPHRLLRLQALPAIVWMSIRELLRSPED